MRPLLLLTLVVVLALVPAQVVRAEDTSAPAAPVVRDAWVQEALAQAGDNAAELQKVLAHFKGDAQKRIAARFLIANMVGKGYILTELQDAQGNAIAFDPIGYTNYEEARDAIEALEKKHGELDFKRDKKIEDLKTITAAYLIKHIDLSFAAWQRRSVEQRVGFRAFLEYVLPYRGSQEPIDDWLDPLLKRYAGKAKAHEGGVQLDELYTWLKKDIGKRVRFNPRYYMHPTDQGFTEMGRSGMGRCEDITNMQTYAARALALATAADYTPYWARGDNNHAWNVLLNKEGVGFTKAYAHAAKIYRKTYAIQRDSLPFDLPEGREAPNRFMASTTARDVTGQYGPTTDVVVEVGVNSQDEKHAYLCVFNGGTWKAIQWSRIEDGRATFARMGRNLVYLPMMHDGTKLVATAPPLLVKKDGTVESLPGTGAACTVTAVSVRPKRKNVDTLVEKPISYLKAGTAYVLKRWDIATGTWVEVSTREAGDDPLAYEGLPADALYWLIPKESRRLERVWTITPEGFQLWW